MYVRLGDLAKAKDWFRFMASSLLALELAKQRAKANSPMLFHCFTACDRYERLVEKCGFRPR